MANIFPGDDGSAQTISPQGSPPPTPGAPAPAATQPYYSPPGTPATAATPGLPAGPGPYATWGDVPGGAQNVLTSLRDEFEALIGYTQDIPQWFLLAAANLHVQTLADFGKIATQSQFYDAYPWAKYGLTKDEYASAASIYGTEYKKVTGQDISQQALQEAFRNPRDPTGGLLTGSQYQQQLMQDANIQKQYGWVRYGLDYSAWTAQKLQTRTALGRDINDAEAANLLQYNVSSRGSNVAAISRASGQQAPTVGQAGVGQSVAR